MAGFAKNALADRKKIGKAVAAARAARPAVPWKVLEERYQRSRGTLWRYVSDAEVVQGVTKGNGDGRQRD
jgi:hypothetical protein